MSIFVISGCWKTGNGGASMWLRVRRLNSCGQQMYDFTSVLCRWRLFSRRISILWALVEKSARLEGIKPAAATRFVWLIPSRDVSSHSFQHERGTHWIAGRSLEWAQCLGRSENPSPSMAGRGFVLLICMQAAPP
jgi:hypothetical protein